MSRWTCRSSIRGEGWEWSGKVGVEWRLALLGGVREGFRPGFGGERGTWWLRVESMSLERCVLQEVYSGLWQSVIPLLAAVTLLCKPNMISMAVAVRVST